MNEEQKLYNHDIEKKLIGSVLLDSTEYYKVSGIIAEEDFHHRPYQEVWTAFRKITMTSEDLNVETIQSELSKKDGDWFGIIIDATSSTVTSSGAVIHARAIKDLSTRRKMANLLSFVATKTYDLEYPVSKAIKGTFGVLSEMTINKERDGINSTEAMLDFLSSLNDKSIEVPVSSPSMRKLISGYEAETLTIYSGRPGMGKTAWELYEACNQAMAGYKVGLISLEMSAMQIWQRILCGAARVPYEKIKQMKRENGVSDKVMERFRNIVNSLADRYKNNLVIYDRSGQTTEDVYITAMREKFDILWIDHLGLLGDDKRGWDKNEKIGYCSWQGKRIAKDLHIPVVMLSQLNRDVEKRSDKRPTLSDLRDSGEVEQNADVVIGIYRDDYYSQIQSDMSEVEFQILKNRNGRLGRWMLDLNMQQQWFFEKADG